MLKKTSVAEVASMDLDEVDEIELVKPGAITGRVVYRRGGLVHVGGNSTSRAAVLTRLAVVVMDPEDEKTVQTLLDVLGKRSSPEGD